MPLIYGFSDKSRSQNIATLRRDGYSAPQASAIAYKIQRQEQRKHGIRMTPKRRSLRRRDRGLAYANPTSGSAISTGLMALGVGAAIGGGLGALGGAMAKPQADPLGGAVAGGSVGVGVTAVGGFIYGLVSPEHRNAGFAAAGIGFGGLLLLNLATNVATNSTT